MGLVLALIVAAVAWYIKNKDGADFANKSEPKREHVSAAERDAPEKSGKKPQGKKYEDRAVSKELINSFTKVSLRSGEFEILKNCSLVNHRHNDGDSFHVKHGGKETEFRLYFVDTAESAYKKYGRGENNGKRLREQGDYFGGLEMQQTTALGKIAKSLVKDLLKKQKFTVVTKWENVYSPERKYCYVIVNFQGREVYLHELLCAKGLVRIKTRGASIPGGVSYHQQKKKLLQMEAVAKRLKLGGWGM